MRNIKKNFFETLLRLTLLANVLRHTTNRIDLEHFAYNTHNYIIKQNLYDLNNTYDYIDEILMNNRLSLMIAPATFLPTTPSQKDFLTNLIQDNTFNKEDFEMEIDLQTILQQDIDLGITSASNGFEYNYYPEQNNSKQVEFYKETQKNADILATTDLFEHNCVPDGYKLVLEEDTGEYFLILMTNDSNKTEYSRIQIKDSTGFASNLNSSNRTDPNFLSQASINQELEKLNENLNLNTTNLDESLSNLDTENLLDETWINQLLVDSENIIEPSFDQIKIQDDKMLSNLNENNQTFVLSPPMIPNNYLINDTIYNDTVQFESMLDQAIMMHDKDKGGENRNKSNELDLNQLLNYVDDASKINSTMKYLSLTTGQICFNTSVEHESDDDKAKIKLADEENINFRNSNRVYDIEFKQEVVDSELEPNYTILSTIKNNVNSTTSSSIQTPALNGFIHNHTYLATSNSDEDTSIHHPYSYKNKLKKMLKNMKKTDGEKSEKHASRDEQLLRDNNIPITLKQIVDTSADEFNDLIREYTLTNDQIVIAKDIRRRGKNKVAAQICRKRKLDSIDSLKENVQILQEKRSTLCTENSNLQKEIREATARFNKLYQEAIGSSFNSTDPTIVSINNLREQLNTKEVHTSETKMYLVDDSNSRDMSFTHSSLINETDEDEDDDDLDDFTSDEDDDEDDENSINSSMFDAKSSRIQKHDTGSNKKMRKF